MCVCVCMCTIYRELKKFNKSINVKSDGIKLSPFCRP